MSSNKVVISVISGLSDRQASKLTSKTFRS